MEKVSLESFKNKFNEETKTELLDELTGGVLGSCHCQTPLYGIPKTEENRVDN